MKLLHSLAMVALVFRALARRRRWPRDCGTYASDPARRRVEEEA